MAFTNSHISIAVSASGTVFEDFVGDWQATATGAFSATISESSSGNITGTWSFTGGGSASNTDGAMFGVVNTPAFTDTGNFFGTAGSLGISDSGFRVSAFSGFLDSSNNLHLDPFTIFVDGEFGSLGVSTSVNTHVPTGLEPIISIDHYTGRVPEDGHSISVTISRSGADLTGTSSVMLSTQDGAAVSTGLTPDFTAVDHQLVQFAAGVKSVTVQLDNIIIDDAIPEANENFHLVLSDPVNGVLGFASGDVTIVDNDQAGTDSGETMAGGTGNDSVDAGGGDDTVAGAAGNDSLAGGTGNDALAGGDGNDSLDGGDGNDTLDGGAGNDTLAGGNGDDVYVVTGAGDSIVEAGAGVTGGIDTLVISIAVKSVSLANPLYANIENLVLGGTIAGGTGSDGDNVIQGNALANALDGGAGNDTLIGLAGNDTLIGGTGGDSMDGGAGADLYYVDDVNDAVHESLAGAAGGIDKVVAAVSFTLGDNIEVLALAPGAASIDGTGNAGSNLITGNDGNNSLAGAGGNDTLAGGAGNDTLDGGDGKDSLAGGAGDDTYHVLLVNPTTTTVALADGFAEAANAGTDTVVVDGAGLAPNPAPFLLTLAANFENLDLSTVDPAARINILGNAANNAITGSGGDNKIDGGPGNDTLDGGGGNDTLLGGMGDDQYMNHAGNETFVIAQAGDTLVNAIDAGGHDTVIVSVANSPYLNAGGFLQNVTWAGTGGAAINGDGDANVLIGAAGADTLDGHAGADTMSGGAGNDVYYVDDAADKVTDSGGTDIVFSDAFSYTLANGNGIERLTLGLGTAATGNTSANLITGNTGNNTLAGGGGADTLVGGDGADTFVFDHLAAGNVETIKDFVHGTDLLGLSSGIAGYANLMAGGLTAGELVNNATGASSGSAAELIYNESTGALYYDPDGAGMQAKVQIAAFDATHRPLGLDASDFTLS